MLSASLEMVRAQKDRPFPWTLVTSRSNRHVKTEWNKVKDDEVRRTTLMRKIGIWEQKHFAGANNFTAKMSLLKA
ncbi:unnamed protein product [Tilletia caries]|nr:unnamed protein product [Tilletia caries]